MGNAKVLLPVFSTYITAARSIRNFTFFANEMSASVINIISPHIDDAILSIGGLIAKLRKSGNQVMIRYIFTFSNWTNQNSISGKQYSSDAKTVTSLRKNEEQAVSRLFDYKYEFLDYYDCPLRLQNPKEDATTSDLITVSLKKLINKSHPCFFPLGIDHPDHILIAEIGSKLRNGGYNAFFYEDLPWFSSANYDYRSLTSLIRGKGLEPMILRIDMDSKMEAIKLYKSQVSNSWIKDIINYSYNLNDNAFYERFWKPINSESPFTF